MNAMSSLLLAFSSMLSRIKTLPVKALMVLYMGYNVRVLAERDFKPSAVLLKSHESRLSLKAYIILSCRV